MSYSPADELNESIKLYLEQNPELLYKNFAQTASKFSASYEKVRHVARNIRQSQSDSSKKSPAAAEPISTEKTTTFKENFQTGEANFAFTTPKRITCKEDLIEAGLVDLKEFEIISYEVGTWEGYRKDKKASLTWDNGVMDGFVEDTGKLRIETLYRVNVKLKRRTLDNDLIKQKELILAEIKSQSPWNDSSLKTAFNDMVGDLTVAWPKGDKLLELALFDPHFGKQSWAPETGEDYDLKIAEKRYKAAIKELLSKINISSVERILFPIGNDMVNIDNKNNTTTAGTPQDTDSRFMKIVQVVKRILVEVISDLSLLAPVDVVVVPGNHDTVTTFMIGEMLESFFHGNPRVSIDNTPKMRKYYQFGKVGLMLTHGNEERHDSLGLIFATEQADLWAMCSAGRYCQIGHFHKNKTIKYIDVDEHQGFQIQVLPSLSGTDAWHYKRGYMSKKAAKAFLFDKEKGLDGEFPFSV